MLKHRNLWYRFLSIVLYVIVFSFTFQGCSVNRQPDIRNIALADVAEQKVVKREDILDDVEAKRLSESEELCKEPENDEQQEQNVSLLAVGDDLIHIQLIEAGKTADGYNYDFMFSKLKDRIEGADIAVINQETVLGGKKLKYSGYPTFNSPTEIGDAIYNAGFDVVLHATNHSMDKGVKGIQNTLDFWKQYPETTVLGMYSSEKEQNKITVVEKNGIKIAMLNYTYGLNGYTLPKDKKYLVNLLQIDRMKKDIKKAKKLADFVIVYPHWGTEYVDKPDANQKKLTKFFAEQGVDLVIGTHPHVIEPVEWVKAEDGHEMLVYYSLGNYISYQKRAPRMLGAMAEVTITKSENETYISKASVTPIVTHYEGGSDYHYAVYLLSDYSEKLAKKHGVRLIEQDSPFSYAYLKKLSKKVLGAEKEIEILNPKEMN